MVDTSFFFYWLYETKTAFNQQIRNVKAINFWRAAIYLFTLNLYHSVYFYVHILLLFAMLKSKLCILHPKRREPKLRSCTVLHFGIFKFEREQKANLKTNQFYNYSIHDLLDVLKNILIFYKYFSQNYKICNLYPSLLFLNWEGNS